MIWVRRFFVLPVGAVFLVLLAFTLFGSRVAATLYDPEFYKRHLAEQEVYSFVLGDLAAAAVDEVRDKPQDSLAEALPDNPFDALGLPTTDLVRSLNVVFPRDWVQQQMEGAIDQVVGYLNGEREELDVHLAIDERVPAASDELKSLIGRSRVHSVVLEHYVAAEVDEALAQGAEPLGVRLDRDDVVAAIDGSVPEEWLSVHVNAAIDEVAAYMSSKQDSLRIHVPLYERADAAIEELNALYAGSSQDSGQLADQIASELEAALPPSVEFTFGVSLTAAEVAGAVAPELSGPWLDEQAGLVVASAAPYIIGKTDDFRANISTVEGRKASLAAVEALALERLQASLDALRECGRGEMPFGARAPMRNEMPRCLPQGSDTDAMLDTMDVDVAGEVASLVGSEFPDSVEYTHEDLRLGMGGEASSSVLAMDRLRILFSDGWTYTEADLLEDWTDEDGDAVDNLRTLLTDGWRLTQANLDDLAYADDDSASASDSLERVRSLPVGSAGLTLVAALVLIALLAAAGLLGGQTWRGRIAWASGTLAVTSLLLLLVTTLSIGPVFDSAIGELKSQAAEDLGSPAARLGMNKTLDVVQSMGDDFVGGVAGSSLWLFVIGALAFGLTFVPEEFISRFRRPREGS